MTATVSPKGQITIPQTIREQLGICPDMQMKIEVTPDGHLDIAPADGLSKAERTLARLRQIPTRGLSAETLLVMTRGEE
ncbi:MAG: AbrB/MazE/SpoVT family DNA-binding domain-containing protein [Planctomycetes bacterium]|nr:AbrB/MazE/SpoVT family DNA-binding domain-containing protein [Planctomycetota bacterium]